MSLGTEAVAGPPSGDVVDHVHDKLRDARRAAAAWVDRADALAELAGVVDATAARADRLALTAEELWSAPRSEEDRARLQALVLRAFPTDTEETQ